MFTFRSEQNSNLQAARQVFGRVGLVNAAFEHIAAETEVGVATLYRHFGNKEQLVWAAVKELSPRPSLRHLPGQATVTVQHNRRSVDRLWTVTVTAYTYFPGMALCNSQKSNFCGRPPVLRKSYSS